VNLRSFFKGLAVRPIAPARETEAAKPWYAPLTPREAELAELVAEGLTNAEIATRLGRSKRTTDVRVVFILWKLNLHKRSEVGEWVATHRPPEGSKR
jgi:DNA-binding NarL/FixJ family response regulator